MTTQKAENTREVRLPAPLVERVENRVSRTEFDDSGEYIAYLVEEVLAKIDDRTDDEIDDNREELEDRLKSLGYLED